MDVLVQLQIVLDTNFRKVIVVYWSNYFDIVHWGMCQLQKEAQACFSNCCVSKCHKLSPFVITILN